MKKNDGLIISVVGLGIVVGSLGPTLGLAVTLIFSLGLGLVIGGVFREIRGIKNKADE